MQNCGAHFVERTGVVRQRSAALNVCFLLRLLFEYLGNHRSVNITRSDAVNQDLLLGEVNSQGANHAHNASLSDAVRSDVLHGVDATSGSYNNHLALDVLCFHCASNRSHQEEVALQVYAEQLVPLLRSNVNSVHTRQCNAGGSYEDVDLAEVFLCNLDYVVDGLLAGYVACNANCLGALSLQLFSNLMATCLRYASDNHVSASCSNSLCCCLTDAGVAANYDGALSCKMFLRLLCEPILGHLKPSSVLPREPYSCECPLNYLSLSFPKLSVYSPRSESGSNCRGVLSNSKAQ